MIHPPARGAPLVIPHGALASPARDLPEPAARRWALDLRRLDDLHLQAAEIPEPEARQRGESRMTPQRLREWSAGRWLVRRLLAEHAGRDPTGVAVVRLPGGAPQILEARESEWAASRWSVTLSHRAGLVGALIWSSPELRIGLDLERIEPRSRALQEDFFHPAETDWVLRQSRPDRAASVLWSLKEAALKALRLGLAADTRRVRLEPDGRRWRVHLTGDLESAGPPLRCVVHCRSGWIAAVAIGGQGCDEMSSEIESELGPALAAIPGGE